MRKKSKRKQNRKKSKRKKRSTRTSTPAGLFSDVSGIVVRILSYSVLVVLTLGVLLFALSTIMAWFYQPEPEPRIPPDVTLEVLNGCGVDGAAKEFTSVLRNHGFTVIDFRNAERFDYERTVISVNRGNSEIAEVIADYIGCPFSATGEPDGGGADLSVIIGEDWRGLKIVTGREGGADHGKSMLDFFDEFHYFE